MEALVGVKIGCLLALLALTLFCGIIPICFKWFRIHAATGKHRRVLSLLGCVSAGVFLGAGLMHMTAEALEGIDSEIQSYILQNRTGSEGNSSDTTDSTDVSFPQAGPYLGTQEIQRFLPHSGPSWGLIIHLGSSSSP
ncbi:zinc transporter ZIP2 isoform X2 [Dromiciops gliroides]|uniref:zinc transporter ZIP2 isoform X2 n=1 Tax=Dromiciops gliroides TaxID=33562 RepID=UPI001CC7D162|nr:zinc transporter ZIP2 isoform X2 [Dromiciops gliroides]